MKRIEKNGESTRCKRAIIPYHLVALMIGIPLAIGPITPVRADNVKILNATTEVQADGPNAFPATLQHPDEGWSCYADRWEVVGTANITGQKILN